MSKNGWEAGTIKVPTKAWAGFKKALREAYTARNAELYLEAVKLHEQLVAAGKGKRGFDARSHLRALIERRRGLDYHDGERIFEAVFPCEAGKPAPTKPRVPKKASFAPATGKTVRFAASIFAAITIDDKTTSVRWRVEENNHAVEEARDSYMGRKLFDLLHRIEWVRGSGGVISGNDEYNEDDNGPGGAANYITARFGPVGEQIAAETYGVSRRRFR